MVLDRGRDDRQRPSRTIQIERMTPLVDAPAVVLAAAEKMGGFPKILAVRADPDLARWPIDAHPPWVPQADRPQLGPRAWGAYQGVVRWYRVSPPFVGMLDVDPQHTAQKIARVLARD